MDELTYILKRVLQMIPVLLVVTVAIFFGMRLIPGDPAILLVGNMASDEAIAAMRTKMGLDQPLFSQFDFGNSLSLKTSVTGLFAQKAQVTVSLTLMTIFFAALISIPLGCYAGTHRKKAAARLIDSLSLFFVSIPEFLIGLVLLLVFALKLRILPAGCTSG